MTKKEYINRGSAECSNGPEMSEVRKLAQHYFNGLRISAFLIRHGFNRMKVKYFMRLYENWIYPFLYRN